MTDYIPLVTNDFKIAFCQSVNNLPSDVQQIIWKKVLETNAPTTPPPAPRKINRMMNRWKSRRSINF